jgi:hypothetical protein
MLLLVAGLVACGSAFDGSFLVDLRVNDADKDGGFYEGAHYQVTAHLLTTADGQTLFAFEGLELVGSIEGTALAVESSTKEVHHFDDGCIYEAEEAMTLDATFTSYDSFLGNWNARSDYVWDGCGIDDDTADWGAAVFARRIFDGPQVGEGFAL